MPTPPRLLTLSRSDARRLALSRQHLSAARPPADATGLRTVLRSLRYLQLDPVSVVAPSHELVLWSRLGPRAGDRLPTLWWQERWLFEYWAHAAALVLTEDYPVHRVSMDGYPPKNLSFTSTWMAANGQLSEHILHRLAEGTPLPTDAFEDRSVMDWPSSGWTAGRNVERMLTFLWLQGRIMVAGRAAGQRLWGLPDACLPADADRVAVSPREMVTTATEHTLRALGVARPLDIKQYFVRGKYDGLPEVLRTLTGEGRVVPVKVEDAPTASETWYVHTDALAELEAIRAGDWEGRTALLSPFDNLINDRRLTERLWGFAFRNEMYVPKAKREYGYYLLPVLHGDRLVGRTSPRFDKSREVLLVEGLYLEPDTKPTAALCRAVTAQLADLAALVGATGIEYGDKVPDRWRPLLH
ncbi:winged helix-turn-helix domain-containing protein [Streptomyces sp. NBC_01236]|uniref:winged helix-turn-helix domain-containing protein n=1 Tax=Streptomyces sp. NBC_01236 TaxID=2903789 RepID=UPI002E0F0D75|nr:winged helix DNA-binding domain-containing protein [Streptomyces sp. NBC_01236]